jgi:16S rRNA (uracil1498-N3)-methyltransferase
MPRRRFFIPQDRIQDGIAVLTPDQAHHLRTVLRLQAGEEVELFDGEGLSFSGKIEYQGANTHIGALKKLEQIEARKSTLVLASALIKADRFEWMLQKGTELGVDQFVPLLTRFAAVHIPGARLDARLERWRRIVMEASKQSRRLTVPKIHTPLPWDDFLASQEYAVYARFMLYEKASERIRAIPSIKDCVLLCVGPEGGWEDSEAQAAANAGFKLTSMGSRILRAETAALAAVSIFQFLLDQR